MNAPDKFSRDAERAGWPIRCDSSLAFVARRLRTCLASWRTAAGDRSWPARTDLTARAMKSFLSDLSILDVERSRSGLRFRARVTGTNLARTFGSAPGKFLDEVVPAPFLERWQSMLELALAVGGPVRTTSRVDFREQTFLRVEALYAPLGETVATPDAILVVAHVEANAIEPDRVIAGPVSESAL